MYSSVTTPVKTQMPTSILSVFVWLQRSTAVSSSHGDGYCLPPAVQSISLQWNSLCQDCSVCASCVCIANTIPPTHTNTHTDGENGETQTLCAKNQSEHIQPGALVLVSARWVYCQCSPGCS